MLSAAEVGVRAERLGAAAALEGAAADSDDEPGDPDAHLAYIDISYGGDLGDPIGVFVSSSTSIWLVKYRHFMFETKLDGWTVRQHLGGRDH